jgi:hypothetical protein
MFNLLGNAVGPSAAHDHKTKGGGFAGTIMGFMAKSSSVCDATAGYISFRYTISSAFIAFTIAVTAHLISRFTKGSTRIQTTIASVDPDTHVLHDFPDAIITPREEERSKRVRQGDKYVTKYYKVTVYDVSNFVSPNGDFMNTLKGLGMRPSSSLYPVRLNNGSVDGGTVEKPSKYWNPCITTLDHKGNRYENVARPHNETCSSLLTKGWDVYLQEDGSIKTNNIGAYGKVILQIVALLATVQLVYDVVKLSLLVKNGFYSEYKLPGIFKSGELGTAGKMYAKWWTIAYKADAGGNCLKAIGDLGNAAGAKFVNDVTDAAESVTNVVGTVTETAALAYLASMASAKDVRNIDPNMSVLAIRTMKILAVRTMLLCLLLLIIYIVLRRYVFTTILKVEEGNDRPMLNYVIVALCAVIITFMFRKYVYIAHSSTIRSSFKKKVLEQIVDKRPHIEDFKARFHSIDFSRIAI